MATVTSLPNVDRAESDRRVRHPLERLRATLRRYVALEGLAILLLYLALWFWIGLLLDYGVFKTLTVDWVQEAPWFLRAFVLAAMLAGLVTVVTVKVLIRLLREFRDSALALVLERRFPKLLGDRLITAVELADPVQAARHGYSQVMVDQTIAEAARQVEQIKIDDVFDWGRLRRAGLLAFSLTAGLGLVMVLAASVFGKVSFPGALNACWDVASIWVERNVLLANTLWPRQAYLEVLSFPGSGEMRIGRDSARPTLRVRAYKWVVADAEAPEGWRSLRWSELGRADLLGSQAPGDLLPGVWFVEMVPRNGLLDDEKRLEKTLNQLGDAVIASSNPRGIADALVRDKLLTHAGAESLLEDWTVDQVELQFERDKEEQKQTLKPGLTDQLDDVFARLQDFAGQPSQSRRLRALTVPATVELDYRGDLLRERPPLTRQGDNDYAFDFAGLKESIRFTVRGEDYVTPVRRITLVPPPVLVRLTRTEERPLYLDEWLAPDGNMADLAGKKRALTDLPPILVTGETSRIDEVPAGTNMVLTAEADKDLTRVKIVPAARKVGPARNQDAAARAPADAIELLDPRTFRVRLQNLSAPLDFFFEFTDTDNVVGRRHVVIEPRKDAPPEVKVMVEVLRRTTQGLYLVTPSALLPFSGEIRDDSGLSQLDYVFVFKQVKAVESDEVRLTASALGGLSFLAGPWGADLSTLGLAGLTQVERGPAAAGQGQVPLDTFARRRRAARQLIKEHLLDRDLAREVKDQSPDFEGFDLDRHVRGIRTTDEKVIQPHFDLKVWLLATDNNADSGPAARESERFGFRVVSENELLVEVGKEEENLHDKLEKVVNELKEARSTALERIVRDLPALKAAEAGLMTLRVKEIEDVVVKTEEKAAEVLRDYRRILHEMKANRVHRAMIAKVEDKICKPLDNLLDATRGEVSLARDALADLHKAVEAATPVEPGKADLGARRLDQLIEALNRVLDAMGELTTMNKMIKEIVEIANSEQRAYERLKALKDKMELKLIDDALNPLEKK